MSRLPTPDPKMKGLGIINSDWGVCGFTSSFYAMYELNPATQPQIINATAAYRVLAEIKTYLMLLKAEASGLLNDIRDFTRTFGTDFRNFEIDAYIARINDAMVSGTNAQPKSEADILQDPLFGIAMPPKAVADYIERMFGWKTSISEFPVGTGQGQGIIGVSSSAVDDKQALKPYHGLEHYMYRGKNGTVYSWGKDFPSVQAASRYGMRGVLWRVCYLISIAQR